LDKEEQVKEVKDPDSLDQEVLEIKEDLEIKEGLAIKEDLVKLVGGLPVVLQALVFLAVLLPLDTD
jgi:hypothetical protein